MENQEGYEEQRRRRRRSCKSQKPSRYRKRAMKRRRRIFILAVEAILVLGLMGFLFIQAKFKQIQGESISPDDLAINPMEEGVPEVLEGYLNIAIFGVDARDNSTLEKGTHSDVVMICSINQGNGEIRLVSVYRDTWLNIKDDTNFNKMTASYFQGGASQAVKTLNKNLDLNIRNYVIVNWKAVADAINILGGVDVEITKEEFAVINGFITETVKSTGVGSVHLKSAGVNHLDGVQAVAYARLRKMDDDFRRTERQRMILSLMMEKAKSADIGTLIGLVDVILPQIKTNLDKVKILNLVKHVPTYDITDTTGFPFDRQSKTMGKKGSCEIPLGLSANVQQLHEFLFASEIYSPSATVKKIDQMIKDNTGLVDPEVKSKPNSTETTPTTSNRLADGV